MQRSIIKTPASPDRSFRRRVILFLIFRRLRQAIRHSRQSSWTIYFKMPTHIVFSLCNSDRLIQKSKLYNRVQIQIERKTMTRNRYNYLTPSVPRQQRERRTHLKQWNHNQNSPSRKQKGQFLSQISAKRLSKIKISPWHTCKDTQ